MASREESLSLQIASSNDEYQFPPQYRTAAVPTLTIPSQFQSEESSPDIEISRVVVVEYMIRYEAKVDTQVGMNRGRIFKLSGAYPIYEDAPSEYAFTDN